MHVTEWALSNGRDNNDAIDLERIDTKAAKIQLARRLIEAIEARDLTQAAAATLLGIDQPKVSRIMRMQISEFSASRLMRFLTLIGRDIEIVIRATGEGATIRTGHLRIVANSRTET